MQQNIKMEQNFKDIILFNGLTPKEISEFLQCIKAKTISLKKGEELFFQGEKLNKVALVISGMLSVIRIDYWGRRDILSTVTPNNIFGAGYAYSSNAELPVSVEANCDTEILLLDSSLLITPCQKACLVHQKVQVNLIKILAKRNVILLEKIQNLSHRTTREKILSLISYYAENSIATLPYNRQEMADYLCIDRASLSRELSKLQKEKILKFKKNKFTLLQDNNNI